MSDDIDRLKTVLEGLAQTNDELKDISEAFRDVVNVCSIVLRETDPEGHGALRDIAGDIKLAYSQMHQLFGEIGGRVWDLQIKAGVPL